MEDALVQSLWEANKDGLYKDAGNFRPAAWHRAVDDVQSTTWQLLITTEICQNRWRKVKKTWSLWKQHKIQTSDWHWHCERLTLFSAEEVMNEYFGKHSEMV